MSAQARTRPSVAVIGTGFGGIAAAIELKKRGYDDLVVLEKGDDVGGVWRENTYPGAACDVPSPFYSYSFAPNPGWTRRFALQPQILDYIRDVADRHDVRRHIRFGAEVSGASWDDDTRTWTVHVAGGDDVVVDVLVPAVGQLSRPGYPDIPGRDTFAGPAFHSALWRHDVDLAGKRVVVIGTGASAIQFVPELQKQAAHLTVVQRTPPHIAPRLDQAFSPRHQRMFATVPATELAERGLWYASVEALSIAWVHSPRLSRAVERLSRWHMRRQTAARPGLFEKVWPSYQIGCKRVLFSNDYLPALTQPNVDLVTDRVAEITPTGVVTVDADGERTEHPADVLVWGTGFKATEFLAPMHITGAGGRPLADAWAEGAHAYYGLTVPDFPNFVMMYGPNTNTGGGSVIYFLEAQADYLGDFVDEVARTGAPLDVRAEVEQDYDAAIQAELATSVWSRCTSWYRQADGRVTTNWPRLGRDYRRQASFAASDYRAVPAQTPEKVG